MTDPRIIECAKEVVAALQKNDAGGFVDDPTEDDFNQDDFRFDGKISASQLVKAIVLRWLEIEAERLGEDNSRMPAYQAMCATIRRELENSA